MSTTETDTDPKAHWAFETKQVHAGATPGLVRLAVGIEGIDDILADLEQGFTAARPFSAAQSTDPATTASF
jgi:O-acetylhomoserine (thiol)-lyase